MYCQIFFALFNLWNSRAPKTKFFNIYLNYNIFIYFKTSSDEQVVAKGVPNFFELNYSLIVKNHDYSDTTLIMTKLTLIFLILVELELTE